MFRLFVSSLQFSRLKTQVKRQVPRTKHARIPPVVPFPTHLRMGSPFCFPPRVRDKSSGSKHKF